MVKPLGSSRVKTLLLLALLAGCRFVEEPETIVCDADEHCPPDYWCVIEGGDATGLREDDCNDDDVSINPGADDVWGDDIDRNCDGVDGTDADRDGQAAGDPDDGLDCDDTDPLIHSGADDECTDGIGSCWEGSRRLG